MNKLLRLSLLFVLTLFAGLASADKLSKNLPTAMAGEKRQETLFSKGQLGTRMLNEVTLESEGISLSTLPNTILDLPVRYNQNGEGKINWNKGTKLVFTAKDNVTGIVIDAGNAQRSTADKGSYEKGVWSGSLAVGEQLTLTADDGINVASIVVLYNGEKFTAEEVEDVDVQINLNITKTNWSTIGSPSGEVVGVVSSNTPNFDYYRFDIRCEDDPEQYITFNDLLNIYGNIVCTSPEMGPYDLFKGQHYVLTAYAYDTPQYGVKPVAVATYNFVGEGKSPVIYSDETIARIQLPKSTDAICNYVCSGLSFNVAFTAPMSSVNAVSPQGMDGSVRLTAAKANADGTVWTITIPESLRNGSSETQLPTAGIAITAKDAEGHALRTANDNHPYEFVVGFYEQEIEAPLATLTIDGEVIELSETEAVQLAVYPEGAVIAINNDDAAIKKISYELVDKTINAVIKSQGDLTKGEDGIWRAEMPRGYELAKGHEYSIHVMARNGMSSFTSQIIYEYNFLVNGTANVASYSSVKVASLTPGENVFITEEEPVITIAFTEAIASLSVTAILGQMMANAIPEANISTEDHVTWTVNVPAWALVKGSLSLDFVAIDKDGNRVTDEKNGVGLPENCYINYAWSCTVGLPTPQLAESDKELETITSLTFQYDGIGLNTDNLTAAWKNIVILKDGEPMDISIEASQFKVVGEDAGKALVWTLPVVLYKGVYTVKIPARSFILGHDNLNWYNGDCEFNVTATAEEVVPEPVIVLNITKTTWDQIGAEAGEVIGTAELKNAREFDHIEIEIRCAEDPDQYISFANMRTNGGNIVCYCWEGGHYTLNKGYHYTLTAKAFDVPYYGATPVAVATYEFIGTGAEVMKYSDIDLVNVDLPEDKLLYHGYDLKVTSFDVTFSAPVSKLNVWGAMGMDGSVKYSAQKKSDDGTVWTIILDDEVLNEEGSINLMIQAWDAQGVQAKGWNGDHAFDMNLIVSLADVPDSILALESVATGSPVYTLNGMRITAKQMRKGQIYVVDGKKFVVK